MEGKEPIQPSYKLKDAGHFRLTPRTYVEYEDIFSLGPRSFAKGARILDIGSGTNQEFAHTLTQMRPDLKVVSVDPTLALPVTEPEYSQKKVKYDINEEGGKIHAATLAKHQERIKTAQPNTVAGLAPDLPFADNSFDDVFDNHSAFMYLPEENNLHLRYLKDLVRITKPGGHIHIYPLDLYDETLMSEKESLTTSEKRITNLMSELGITTYQIFPYVDHNNTPQATRRLGVVITK